MNLVNVLDESPNAEMLDPGTNENYLNDSDDNFDNQITSSEESDALGLSDAESFETGQV